MAGTFASCQNLNQTPAIPSTVTNMYGAFSGCYNLPSTPTLPSGLTQMCSTFGMCLKIQSCGTIPSTVTNMCQTFYGTNIINPPAIPANVDNLAACFYGCANMRSCPALPVNVTNLRSTFSGCSEYLTTAPNMNNCTLVNDMYQTFAYDNKLTGDVWIGSRDIQWATGCFATFPGATALRKNVHIHQYYQNGELSKTYNAFINAGYDTAGTTDKVYLMFF